MGAFVVTQMFVDLCLYLSMYIYNDLRSVCVYLYIDINIDINNIDINIIYIYIDRHTHTHKYTTLPVIVALWVNLSVTLNSL